MSPKDAASYIQSYESSWWRFDQAKIDAIQRVKKKPMRQKALPLNQSGSGAMQKLKRSPEFKASPKPTLPDDAFVHIRVPVLSKDYSLTNLALNSPALSKKTSSSFTHAERHRSRQFTNLRHTFDNTNKKKTNFKNLAQVDREFTELLKKKTGANPTNPAARPLLAPKMSEKACDLDENERFWKETVIPNWDRLYKSPIVQHFWSRDGLPFSCRGFIWAKMIGNPLEVKKAGFYDFREMTEPDAKTEWSQDIERMFQGQRQAQAKAMDQVLRGFYKFYEGQISYIQPLSYVVRMLLAWMESAQAWKSLVNIVQMDFMTCFVNMKVEGMLDKFRDFELIMEVNLPGFIRHLGKIGIPVDTFLVDWVFTMFVKPLPLALACRIWDNFFLFGEIYLWKTCVGLICWLLKHHRLRYQGLDGAMRLLRFFPRITGDQFDELIQSIAAVRVPHLLLKKFQKERQKDDALAQWNSHCRKSSSSSNAPQIKLKPSAKYSSKEDILSLQSEKASNSPFLQNRASGFYLLN